MNCSGIVACLLEAMAAGTPASKPTTGRRLLYASLRFSPHSGTFDLDPDSEALTEVIKVSMRARALLRAAQVDSVANDAPVKDVWWPWWALG